MIKWEQRRRASVYQFFDGFSPQLIERATKPFVVSIVTQCNYRDIVTLIAVYTP